MQTDTLQDITGNKPDHGSCQLLTFSVGGGEYGVDIMKVREIKVWSEPTRLPGSPPAMRGVINLRGTVVPIFDMRLRFDMGLTEVSEKHVVIIMTIGHRIIGLLVDAVSDILTVNHADIRSAPDMQSQIDDAWVKGLISLDKRMVILLETEKLFHDDDIEAADTAMQTEEQHA
jgi:purine-binding chemotaxis protein CheW